MKNQWYRDVGIKEVYDRPIIIKDFIVLSHAPQPFMSGNNNLSFIYGHVHDSKMFETYGPRHFCACVERHDYKPVNIEEVIKYFQEKGEE